MRGIRISSELAVDIIVFERVNKILQQNTVEIKSCKIIHGVFERNHVSSWSVSELSPCILTHHSYLSGVLTSHNTLVSDVTDHHAFSSNWRDQSVKEQDHYSEVVVSFDKQSFSFLFLDNGLDIVVDVVILFDSEYELVDFRQIVMDRLK
jgi:hypothetical protein